MAFFWALTTRVATGIAIGPYTLNAYLTFVAAIIATLLFAVTLFSLFTQRARVTAGPRSLHRVTLLAMVSPLPFLTYSLISLAQSQLLTGLQNTLVWLIFSFGFAGMVFGLTAAHIELIRKGLVAVAIFLPGSKIIPTLAGFDFQGQSTFAITALVVLAWTISKQPRNWLHHLLPWWVFVAILFAEVRMAGVTAAVMMLFLVRHLPVSPAIRALSLIPAAVLSAAMVWLFLGDKFVRRVSQGVELIGAGNPSLGSLEILGTSERGPGWVLLIESLGGSSNVWGQGAGETTRFFLTDYPIGHAHNEYLRIFYDFGWVGLFLFLAGALGLFLVVATVQRKSPSDFSFAALLIIPAIAVLSLTDNPIVYVMAMLPAAVIIAGAFAETRLGMGNPSKSSP